MCLCVFKQKTAYEMRIIDWSSDVGSSDREVAVTVDDDRAFRVRVDRPARGATDEGGDRGGHAGDGADAAGNFLDVDARIGERRWHGISSEARRVGTECVSTCRSRW